MSGSNKSTKELSRKGKESTMPKKQNMFGLIKQKFFGEKQRKTSIDTAFNNKCALAQQMRMLVSEVSKEYLGINADMKSEKESELAKTIEVVKFMNLGNERYVRALLIVADARRKIGEGKEKLKRNRGSIIDQATRILEAHCREVEDAREKFDRRSAEMDEGKRQIAKLEKETEQRRNSKDKLEKLKRKLDNLENSQTLRVGSFNTEAERLTVLLDEIPEKQQRHKASLEDTLREEYQFYIDASMVIEQALKKMQQSE